MAHPKTKFAIVFLVAIGLLFSSCKWVSQPLDSSITETKEIPPSVTPAVIVSQTHQPTLPPLADTPIARSHTAMTFDNRRGVVIVFGGSNGTGTLNDTWEYDGFHWYQVYTTTSPPPRADHRIEYDPHRDIVVLFGGENWQESGKVVYGDLWEYDGQNWKQVHFTEMPAARTNFLMSYFPPEEAIFIAGGDGDDSATTSGTIGDAWLYDGSLWQGGINNQESRNDKLMNFYFNLGNAEMVYDTKRQLLIILNGQVKHMTIEFNGEKWGYCESDLNVPGDDPDRFRQNDYTLSYAQNRGVSVLFGGLSNKVGADSYPLNDTWEYDGEMWTQVYPVISPTPRYAHAMVYDEARQVIVLFGGIDAEGNRLNDTWEYDGTTWIQR